MALSRTTLVGEISIDGHGSGAFTTSAFTPPNNSLIVVYGGAMDPVGAVNFDDDLTMAGGGLTFTKAVSEEGGAATAFAIAGAIWTAPVTTGASMTLSLDAGARSFQFGAISAVAYTGYNTGSPTGGTGVVIDTVSPDGAQTITLSSSPATDSEVFAGITMDKENAGVVPGAAFTEIHDLQVGATGGIETEIRTGSTSTTVDWVDTWPGGGNIFKIVAAAVEIKADLGAVIDSNQALSRPLVGPYPRLLRTGVLAPFQLQGGREVAIGATPISLSDTATADDVLTAAAAVPLADTASANDALTVAATAALTDTASGSDALAVTAALTLADTAGGADALSVAAAIPLTDTATAVDALAVTVTLTLADTAAADDSLAAGVPITLTETATASDALTVTVSLPLADTASADDSLSVFTPGVIDAYQAPLSIAGMFINPSQASFQLQGDRAQAVSGNQSISLSDTATATDALTITVALPLTDTAGAADALAVTVALALADTATAVDALTAGVPISLSDTASALDSLSVQVTGSQITLTDTASASDSLTITVALALADTASALDAISIPEAPQAAVVSRISTGHQMSRASTGTDARRVSTGTQMSRASSGTDARRIATGHQMSRIVSSQEE